MGYRLYAMMRGECHVSCCRGPSFSFKSQIMVSLERVVLVLVIFIAVTDGLRFHLSPNGKKCIKESVHKGVVVAGEYEAEEAPADQKMDVVVMDTKGHTLVNHQDKVKSRFSFSSDESDDFEMCFISKVPVGVHATNREVTLDVKHGVETKNYDALAESAKLKPLEVELKKLEDLSEAIVSDFAYMRKREEEMRDTNESTNKRVLFLSIFSMLCLLGLATWQVLYLRRYFKAKKLIE